TKLHSIWLQQPLAFARIGTSPTPLSSFRWTMPDIRPRGTGKTAIMPVETIEVDKHTGVPHATEDQYTLFRDEHGIRPVCPFFELHGKWDDNEGPLTKKILGDCGLSLSDIVWTIHHANHKAYALTHSEGDRIEACRTVKGNDHRRRNLWGWSPPGPKPLV